MLIQRAKENNSALDSQNMQSRLPMHSLTQKKKTLLRTTTRFNPMRAITQGVHPQKSRFCNDDGRRSPANNQLSEKVLAFQNKDENIVGNALGLLITRQELNKDAVIGKRHSIMRSDRGSITSQDEECEQRFQRVKTMRFNPLSCKNQRNKNPSAENDTP